MTDVIASTSLHHEAVLLYKTMIGKVEKQMQLVSEVKNYFFSLIGKFSMNLVEKTLACSGSFVCLWALCFLLFNFDGCSLMIGPLNSPLTYCVMSGVAL